MTLYVITLVDGSTVSTHDGGFLDAMYAGEPVVKVSWTYHIPVASIVYVQEADE